MYIENHVKNNVTNHGSLATIVLNYLNEKDIFYFSLLKHHIIPHNDNEEQLTKSAMIN